MFDVLNDVRHLFEVGGTVLSVIGLVALLLWTLLFERFWYFARIYPGLADGIAQQWDARPDKDSWDAHAIRRLWISELMMGLNQWLGVIRALVTVCPLLGLLGTTSGMIDVYEVMAIKGSGEPRAMAGGVSQAMITTMAGLVVALSGIVFSARLESTLFEERERISSRLHIEEHLLGHHHRVRSHKARERTRLDEERRHEKMRLRERESRAARTSQN